MGCLDQGGALEVPAEAAQPKIDVLGQFRLSPVLGSVNFTQANALMIVGALLVLALLYYGMKPRAVVPGRLQAAAELCYKFVYDMCVDQIGEEGRRFFPFVFTLFFFVLMGNLLGLLPYSFTYTSHIAVTVGLALMVIIIVTIVAFVENGWHFVTEYFFPKGAPLVLAPLIVPIEVISYLSRVVSLSVRLFANMVAGHAMFEVAGAFTIMLAGFGVIGIIAAVIGPLAVNVVLYAFELLVACLQAYVFAILTCIYLHDAVHLH
ncbi:MAG: F0F1 ATP synthase subunit A [Acetobacteraceae bacterium]|nr:F0F1 ATP synthase subunit A [Acetobacteraceae bacterium]